MDMENWDQSVGEVNQKSQKFVIFYEDDNQSQVGKFKRQLDEGGTSDFCLKEDNFARTPTQTADSPLNFIPNPMHQKNEQIQQLIQEHKQQNHQQHHESRPKKQYNNSMYSKVYRQRKKQKMKILQQENTYLKKKVDQLQLRLRQKQMEINRLKFTSPQEHDIKILNEQIMTKLKIISQPNGKQKQQKQNNPIQKPILTGDKRMEEFLRMFDLYGFGGVKAKQLEEYYVNQYIENVMRDREKYYFLNWINKRHQKNVEKTAFEIDLQQAFWQTEEQKKQSIQLSMMIRPVTLQLLKASREIYNQHKIVLRALQKIHSMARSQLSKNIDYTQKRMKMVMWFEANRHRKQMRQIRSAWIEMVKGQDQPWLEDKHKQTGKKKVVK